MCFSFKQEIICIIRNNPPFKKLKKILEIRLEELIRGCCKNKKSAQSKVYQLYADKLFGICLKYSRNSPDAEDILQDSFLIIFNKINQFKHKGSFEGWLKRIVINTAITKYRESKHLYFNEEILLNEPSSENLTIETSEIGLDFLLSSIQKLPNRYRLIFNLYVLDNYSHKDIAKMLNISEGTSKSNLSRARKILKKQIENYSKPIENK